MGAHLLLCIIERPCRQTIPGGLLVMREPLPGAPWVLPLVPPCAHVAAWITGVHLSTHTHTWVHLIFTTDTISGLVVVGIIIYVEFPDCPSVQHATPMTSRGHWMMMMIMMIIMQIVTTSIMERGWGVNTRPLHGADRRVHLATRDYRTKLVDQYI